MHCNRFIGAAALLACSTAAYADHSGPAAIGGSGGALDVSGPSMLGAGEVALAWRTVLALPQDRPDAELEALAEDDIHAHTSDYVLTSALAAAYGITDRLAVSAQIPFVLREDLREGEHSHVEGVSANEVVQLGDVAGIGDLSLIASYRLTGREGSGLALIGGLKLPTGTTRQRSIEGERLETEHQPGSGSWDPVLGVAAGTKLGALQIDGSLTYQFAGKGAQDTTLGDRLQGGVALSHRFGSVEHHHDDPDAGEHHHRETGSWDAFAGLTIEWEGRQAVEGEIEQESGGTALWLTPGLRYNAPARFSVAAGLGVPLWQDIRLTHPDNGLRGIISLGTSF